jgi:hypothetical protein
LEMKPQIREAFLGPTVSEWGERICSASCKITLTEAVSENGYTSSKPLPNFWQELVY